MYALADLADARCVVVAFLGTECPLAKLYGPRLTQLAAKYGDRGLRVIGIDANIQDTPDEIAAYAAIRRFPFPVLCDKGNVMADQFGAADARGVSTG